jgi:MinD superfamily P-loop ATPase
VRLLDCDVEEPNAHLFLGAEETGRKPFAVKVPRIDEQKCTSCGKCVEFCEYNALAQFGKKIMVFDNLCHGCGGCSILCPEGAIYEEDRPIGELIEGRVRRGGSESSNSRFRSASRSAGIRTLYGLLDVGEVLAPPLIRAVKREGGGYVHEKFKLRGDEDEADRETGAGVTYQGEGDVIVDSPPGTTCPMVTAVKDADFGLLVTENTPFGLHDLELAVETLSEMNIPMGVVINRADVGHAEVKEYCRKQHIPVLLEIPYDEGVAAGYAKGQSIVRSNPRYGEEFRRLYRRIVGIVQQRRAV